MDHRFHDGHGHYVYEVKWKGYPDSENTWEPACNLLNAQERLSAYHVSIGGVPAPTPVPASVENTRKRSTSDASTSTTKRHKGEVESDTDDLKGCRIVTVERDLNTGQLCILVTLADGECARVPNSRFRRCCPDILLDFYEKCLRLDASET